MTSVFTSSSSCSSATSIRLGSSVLALKSFPGHEPPYPLLQPFVPLSAARELLALQASDWAFLDKRRQAGDYPYQRVTDHAQALLEAIHSGDPKGPRLRNLAPDLSLAPFLAP